MKYHYTVYLPLLAVILALAWVLSGCANMTPGEQNALDDLGAVAEGVAIVGAVVLDADEPPIDHQDEHRQWCHEHADHQHCK